MKIHVFEKVRCQEATWAEVEPKWSPIGSQDGAQEGAKTSPRGGQDGAKNEKKSEVKLSRVSVCLGRVEGKRCEVVTRPLEEKGRPKTAPRPPKIAQDRPKTDPGPPQDRPRAPKSGPRAAQERPGATNERPRAAQQHPRPPQDRPKARLKAILKPYYVFRGCWTRKSSETFIFN